MKITGNEPAYGGKMLTKVNASKLDQLMGDYKQKDIPFDHYGLTIRQQFAMAAMQGLLSDGRLTKIDGSDVTKYAVVFADALIHELNNTEQ